MTAILIAAGLLAGLTLIAGLALSWAHARLPTSDDGLIDAIDALLPQTQCGQCGHPGCRPYAEALAKGAPMDLCPPGGQETFAALKALLGRDDGAAPAEPQPAIARIREAECIGCALCLAPCPVDAIIGAPGFMHTVIEDQCTGCELCLPACPADCIELIPMPIALADTSVVLAPKERRSAPSEGGTPSLQGAPPDSSANRRSERRDALGPLRSKARSPDRGRPALDCERSVGVESLKPLGSSSRPTETDAPCIGCNRCEPVCPQSLAPQYLVRLVRGGQLNSAAETGLDRCIECRLCDRACPSDIPLAHLFRAAKDERRVKADRQAQATAAKARFDARNARLNADEADAHARRAQRLVTGNSRQW